MNLVNLTPHAIVLQAADGTETTVPASGTVARVQATAGTAWMVDGMPIPVYGPTTYGAVEGIPPPVDGTAYIVSGMVLAATQRVDVFAPGTGPQDGAVRNERGQVRAVTRLIAAV